MRYAIKVMITTPTQSGAKLLEYKGTTKTWKRRADAVAYIRDGWIDPPPAPLIEQLEVVDLNDTSKIGWLSPAMRLY